MRGSTFSIFLTLIFFSLIKTEDFCIGVNQSPFTPIAGGCIIINPNKPQKQKISYFTLTTKSKIKIPTIFYDRSSDILLIAASPLPAPKEVMNGFVKLFPSYDVLTFDYRWSGQYEKYLAKAILAGNPVQKVLFDPIEDLEAVMHYVTEEKLYKKVVGLGVCYSCFHFVKLQSDAIKKYGVGPFTHLILDSCWYSLRDFAERICHDPWLPINSRDGGAPKVIRWVTDSSSFKYITLGLSFCFMNNISIKQYISDVCIPILFVHGKNDLFVPLEHFNKIWVASNKENRAALLTPFRHVDNLGNKKLYRYVAEQFVASQSTHDFKEKVLNN